MSVELTDSPELPGGISAEEWSTLEPLLHDRWPDGRPRPWFPPVLDALTIAATISLLACAAAYGLGLIAHKAIAAFGDGIISAPLTRFKPSSPRLGDRQVRRRDYCDGRLNRAGITPSF